MLHIFIHSISFYRLPKCAKLLLKIKSGNIFKHDEVKRIFNCIVKIILQMRYCYWEPENNTGQNMNPNCHLLVF